MDCLTFFSLLLLSCFSEVLGVVNYCSTNSNPCINGGTCVDRTSDLTVQSWYICRCLPSYSGDHCEITQNVVVPGNPTIGIGVFNCFTNPCLNGGVCVNGLSGAYCQCPSTTAGTRCETTLGIFNPTQTIVTHAYCTTYGNRCLNGGLCIDKTTRPALASWYICSCPFGFSGNHCEIGGGSQTPDVSYTYYCSRIGNPCLNGGLCVDRSQRPTITSWYICTCVGGYSGDHCEITGGQGHGGYTDYCLRAGNPCRNGGACVDRATNPSILSWYTCTCPAGFSGVHCELHGGNQIGGIGGVNNYCTVNPNPCTNGGQCVDRARNPTIVSWYTCTCPVGYSGDHCEHGSNVIGSTYIQCSVLYPCLNGGRCIADRCICPSYCAGTRCDYCGRSGPEFCEDSNPCRNGGTCQDDDSGSFTCECTEKCSGPLCEVCMSTFDDPDSTDVCNPNPCKGDCICQPSCRHSNGYICKSNNGYLGKDCTIPAPTLLCETDRIVISVSSSFVREYDHQLGNSLILISPDSRVTSSSCVVRTATNGFYTYTILFPFDNCGTRKSESSGGEVYTNIMWFNKVLSNTNFDVPVPAAKFQCSYRREYKVITSLRPVVPTVQTIYDSMTTVPSVSLCKSPACPAACPDHLSVSRGGFYTVGETIYVTMHLDIDDLVDRGIVNTIHNMFLSCSENPEQTQDAVYVVQNGCGTTSGLPCEVTHTGKGATVCVNFDTPRLPKCDKFFIHGELRSCKSTNLQTCSRVSSSYCTINSLDRKKRSVANETTTAEVYTVIGPILIATNASTGEPRLDLFPDEEESETLPALDLISLGDNGDDYDKPEGPSRSARTKLAMWLPILVAVLAALLLSLAFVVSLACKSRYEESSDVLVPKAPVNCDI